VPREVWADRFVVVGSVGPVGGAMTNHDAWKWDQKPTTKKELLAWFKEVVSAVTCATPFVSRILAAALATIRVFSGRGRKDA
jgi:hypothetical protein